MCLQGEAIAHLTALQELRLCPSVGVQTFNMQLAGLPPSLRSLEVVNCREPLDLYPRLVVKAPAPGPTVSDSSPSPVVGAGLTAGGSGPSSLPVASQPASPAIPPALESVVMDYLLMALPTPWRLPAHCAATLQTALLTLRGEHAAAFGTDREQVTRPRANLPITGSAASASADHLCVLT